VTQTGLFIRKGPVVQTRDSGGKIDVGADNDGAVLYDGPLVLLTSRFSASATEILAGALQDYGRGLVVGDSATFGKGTVQSIVPLAPLMDRAGLAHAYDPGALKITIAKFYRPSGASTQLRGVTSDIVLPSTTDFSDVSESSLKDPLPWDTIPSAAYQRVERVKPYVSALRAGSALRLKTNPAFAYLAADIQRIAKSVASKSVSLNEAERRAEVAEAKARHERERELAAREAHRPITRLITLANVDARGLPAPVSATPDAGTAAKAAAEPADNPFIEGPSGADLISEETVRILADYVDLLASRGAGHEASKRP
jgi:carboxyl-terminal processing protease